MKLRNSADLSELFTRDLEVRAGLGLRRCAVGFCAPHVSAKAICIWRCWYSC